MCDKRIEKYGMQRIMTGQNMEAWSQDRWKKEIGDKVQEVARDEWVRKMRTKSSLEWYLGKQQPGREPFYDGSMGGELLFKARTKSLELNSRTYRWANEGNKRCTTCESGEDETIEHVLLKCTKYENEREDMLRFVIAEIGLDEWNSVVGPIYEWNLDSIIVYLLGLNRYNKWNNNIAECVKEFLEKAWRIRSKLE